jgi:hypothetical protein
MSQPEIPLSPEEALSQLVLSVRALTTKLDDQAAALHTAVSNAENRATMRIENLEARLPSRSGSATPLPSDIHTPEPPIITISDPPEAARRKPLPWPEKFGGDRTKFPAWKAAMEHKLNRDAPFIGDGADQFYAIWERLEGTAQRTMEPYFVAGGTLGDRSPRLFLETISSHFLDQNRGRRAGQELRQLRQGADQRFVNFYAQFERLMAEAGGSSWPDNAKLHLIEGAINTRLQRALVARDAAPDYQTWVSTAMLVSARLEALDKRRGSGAPPATTLVPKTQDGDGDTPMTGVNTSGARPERAQRAKWVSTEERDKRRREGSCLRCGRNGHRIASCKLAPARNPRSTGVQAASTNTAEERTMTEDPASEASENE